MNEPIRAEIAPPTVRVPAPRGGFGGPFGGQRNTNPRVVTGGTAAMEWVNRAFTGGNTPNEEEV
jgi:hypothetical protein